MWQEQFQKILQDQYQQRFAKNPAVSLRAFAKELGLSPGPLSDLMRGKRQVSPAKLAVVLSKLDLDPDLVNRLIKEASEDRTMGRVLLPEQVSSIVSRWIYFAILSVYDCDRPPKDLDDLASRLGIAAPEARAAVDVLLGAGLLRESSEGILQTTGISWRSEDGVIAKSLLWASHQDGLKLTQKALLHIPADQRDFTSITISANAKNLEKARQEIRKFNNRMAKLLSADKTDCVMRMSVSLFPVDRWNEFENEIETEKMLPNKEKS